MPAGQILKPRLKDWIACSFVVLLGPPAAATPFCDSLRAVGGQGGANVEIMLPDERSTTPGKCQTSLTLSGAQDLHCRWTFAYRAEAAQVAFQDIITDVSACLGPDAVQSTDQSVNHPDAYDLRLFALGDLTYAVSLKDKGALQQTLVFVRIPVPKTP